MKKGWIASMRAQPQRWLRVHCFVLALWCVLPVWINYTEPHATSLLESIVVSKLLIIETSYVVGGFLLLLPCFLLFLYALFGPIKGLRTLFPLLVLLSMTWLSFVVCQSGYAFSVSAYRVFAYQAPVSPVFLIATATNTINCIIAVFTLPSVFLLYLPVWVSTEISGTMSSDAMRKGAMPKRSLGVRARHNDEIP